MHKKIKAAFLTALMVLSNMCAAVYAESDWTCDTTSVAAADAAEGEISLSFGEAAASRSASAEKEFDLSENTHINLEFTAEFSGDNSNVQRRIYLRNSSTKAIELINITGTALEILGSDTGEVLSENTEYDFIIGINPSDKSIAVWLDDMLIHSGNMGTKWKDNFDLSAMKVYIRNNTTSKVSTVVSEFNISGFKISDRVTGFTSAPADGAVFVDCEETQNIKLVFDGALSPLSWADENFRLKKNEKEVGIQVSNDANAVYVTPDYGFESMCTYTLTVISIADVFDEAVLENKSISFTTAQAGYVPPTVEISVSEADIYTNQSTTVSVSAESESGIAKIELFMNGELYREYESGTAELEFEADAGEYEFYAVAWDTNGGSKISETVTVNIAYNEAPSVGFTNVVSGQPYTTGELTAVEVSAGDSDGSVEKIEVYLGDTLISEFDGDNGTVDLSGEALGRYLLKAVCYDNAGASGDTQISLVISGESNTRIAYNQDFSSFSSNGEETSASGIAFFNTGDGKIYSSNEYGEEYGTVVEFRTEGEEVDGKTASGSWARLSTNNTAYQVKLDMDLYMFDDNCTFGMYFKDSSVMQPLTIAGSKMTIGNYGGTNASYDVETGMWHHLTILIDVTKLKYSLWFDGELFAENFGMPNGYTKVETRIFFAFANEVVATGFAFDNVVIEYIEPVPQIVAVGYDDVAEVMTVNPSAKTLRLAMNALLTSSTLNEKSVLLYCGDEPMQYKSVKFNDTSKSVIIELGEKFKSMTQYRAELTEKVTDASGMPLKAGAVANFSTGYADFDVYEAEIVKANGKARVFGKLINSTETDMECFVILNVFSGSKLIDTSVMPVTAAAGGTTTFESAELTCASGNTAEVYFWDSLTMPNPLTLHEYKK